MNRYEYNGNLKKGRASKAAKQAFIDMRTDDCTIVLVDYFGHLMKQRVIITEEMLGIEI